MVITRFYNFRMIWKRGENILILIMEENHKDLKIIAGAVSFIYLQIPSLIYLILFFGGRRKRFQNFYSLDHGKYSLSSIGFAVLEDSGNKHTNKQKDIVLRKGKN